jgi:hypothetical protein
VVAMALLGGAVAFVLGLVLSRVLSAQPDPGFFKALGISCGAVVAIGGLSLGLAWLAADFEPKIDGQNLELAIEVRTPRDFVLPAKPDEYGTYASMRVPGTRTYSPQGKLDLPNAKKDDGRWIVTATVPLITSASSKVMDVRFSKAHSLTFPLPLRSHPGAGDREWSPWVESGWDVGKPQPPPEERFHLRYRVQVISPAPPEPTHAQRVAKEKADEQAKFDAVRPDAPIAAWFPYTSHGAPDDRRAVAIRNIAAKPGYVAELAGLMIADDAEIASEALHLVEHLPEPPAELVPAVEAAGRHLIALMRQVNAATPDQDPGYLGAAAVSIRFSAWRVAVNALREKRGADFIPQLREILELSRVRTDSQVMQRDVRRVASFYAKKWGGIEPLPGDPPPR